MILAKEGSTNKNASVENYIFFLNTDVLGTGG